MSEPDEPTPAGPPAAGGESAPTPPPAPEPAAARAPEPPPAAAAQRYPYGSVPYGTDPAQQYPFAPVARAPREPWIHPRRRGPVIAIAAAVALTAFGAGIGVGIAIAPDGHHERRGPIIIRPYDMPDRGPMGQLPRHGHSPGAGVTPSPAPSATS